MIQSPKTPSFVKRQRHVISGSFADDEDEDDPEDDDTDLAGDDENE